MFTPGFAGETLQFALGACQFLLPSGFILKSFENLRGDRILLFPGKSGYFTQCIFQYFSHKPSVAEGLSRIKKMVVRVSWAPCSGNTDRTLHNQTLDLGEVTNSCFQATGRFPATMISHKNNIAIP